MIYEYTKVLTGFRVKLQFDPLLSLEPTYVFVEVSKTPTIGDLRQDIMQRFKLTQDIFVKLHNCKLIHSENVCVLAAVTQASICVNSESLSTFSTPSCEMNVDLPWSDCIGKTGKEIKKTKQTHQNSSVFTGVASTIKKLKDEQKIYNDRYKALETFMNSDVNNKKKYEKFHNIELNMDGDNDGDGDIDANNEINDSMIEKKKRKRKRKHLKKYKEDKIIINHDEVQNTECIPKSKRKHIYFNDDDNESNNDHEERSSCINNTLDLVEVPVHSNKKNRSEIHKMNESFSENYSDSEMLYNMKNLRRETDKITNSFLSRDLTIDEKKSEILNEKKFFDSTQKVFNNLESINIDNTFSPISSPNFPLRKQEQKKSENSAIEIENELSTLLMCKQLKTCNHYTVQFAGDEELKVNNKSTSSGSEIQNTGNGISEHYKDFECNTKNNKLKNINDKSTDISHSDWNNDFDMDTLSKKESGILYRECDKIYETKDENERDILSECEMLIQFKIDNNKIKLRTPNHNWQILTPEIAKTELPVMDNPKNNQSIVFQILHLNKDMCPCLSDLMYGIILRYKPDIKNVVLYIPSEFVKSVVENCVNELLPEELAPITDNTYEVHVSTLKNAQVLS